MQSPLPPATQKYCQQEKNAREVYANDNENRVKCVSLDQRRGWWWRLTRLPHLDEYGRLILPRLAKREYGDSGR